LDSDTAIITGQKLEQATSMARLSSMAASFDRFGNAVAIGGWDEVDEQIQSSVWKLNIYNARHNPEWRIQEPLLQPSCFGAATTGLNGDIVFTGGGNTPFRESRVFTDSVLLTQSDVHHTNESFPHITSTYTNTFLPLPPLNTARSGHSAVTLFNGSVVVMGGYSGGVSYLNSMEILDPEYSRWLPLQAHMAVSRSGMVAAIGPGGAIYVTGGSPDGSTGHKSLERYDSREGRWVSLSEMHCGRGYTAGCVGSSNNLFVIGGTHLAQLQPGIEVYDFRADRWRHYGVNSTMHATAPLLIMDDADVEEVEEVVDVEYEFGGEMDENMNSITSRTSSSSVSDVRDYFLRASHQVLYMI